MEAEGPASGEDRLRGLQLWWSARSRAEPCFSAHPVAPEQYDGMDMHFPFPDRKPLVDRKGLCGKPNSRIISREQKGFHPGCRGLSFDATQPLEHGEAPEAKRDKTMSKDREGRVDVTGAWAWLTGM